MALLRDSLVVDTRTMCDLTSAGLGMGLPLSQLYARYLGGTLALGGMAVLPVVRTPAIVTLGCRVYSQLLSFFCLATGGTSGRALACMLAFHAYRYLWQGVGMRACLSCLPVPLAGRWRACLPFLRCNRKAKRCHVQCIVDAALGAGTGTQ